ncbi:MAG: YceI family protein [Anaerolineae bacterium]|nr:YceI family protein [Anaerolineae bacterium]
MGAILIIVLGVVGFLIFDRLFPADRAPVVTGVPSPAVNSIDARRTAQAQTQTAAPTTSSQRRSAPDSGIQNVLYVPDAPLALPAQDEPLYISCTEGRVTAPERPTPTATLETMATAEVTLTPTTAPATLGAPDLVRLIIAGSESEACFQVGEIFPGLGEFRVAVGVTQTIEGEVEIDRANVANSLIGDIVININELTSDEPRRDGAIRGQWLESDKYPYATLSNVEIIGLPQRAYVDGEMLNFTVRGDLTIRDVTRPTDFAVTATLAGDLLVVRAETQILMTDFGFDPPNLAFVQADNEARLVLNLVARPATS